MEKQTWQVAGLGEFTAWLAAVGVQTDTVLNKNKCCWMQQHEMHHLMQN